MISILLPSRNRPRNIARFIDSFYQNSRGEIEFLFYIDFDDKVSVPQLEIEKAEYKDLVNIRWVVGERTAISDMYNVLYKEIVNPDIILISGDDVTANTIEWDLLVHKAFAKYKDRLVLVGGSDLLNDSLFTTFCISKEWIDIIGFVMPQGYWDYSDTYHHEIASRISRIEKINAIFEHHHHTNFKAILDDTMREKNILCYGGNEPSHLKFSAEQGKREELAEKIRNKIKENISI